MWLPWRRSPRGRAHSPATATSPLTRSTSSLISPSASLKDICSLLNDTTAFDVNFETPTASPVLHRSSTIHSCRSRPTTTFYSPAVNKRLVLYFTSLGVVRKTSKDCKTVRSILQGLRVDVDERDVSMQARFLDELKELKECGSGLPRLFVDGLCIGGAEEVRQLHDTGELKRLLEGAKPKPVGICARCAGARFVVCRTCNGSHKRYSEKFGMFRTCSACNENGLIRYPECWCSPET